MNREQRVQPRLATALSVRLEHARRGTRQTRTLQNLSLGGIACYSDEPVPTGDRVSVEMAIGGQALQLEGVVVWCRGAAGRFELGLRFDEDLVGSRDRAVRDLAEIERYRHEVLVREGRQLSSDAAAEEWLQSRAAAG
jgi:hypothetical protein